MQSCLTLRLTAILPVVLDWFTGYVGYDASRLRLGEVFEVDEHGSLVRRRSRWETARGSWEAGLQLTRASATEGMWESNRRYGSICSGTVLQLSGNPTKYLQGHNVAGPSVSQLGPILQAVARSLREGLRPADADDPTLPAVHRSRVDVTTACDLGSHDRVHQYLHHLAATGRTHQGRAMDSRGTIYFQKHSRFWTLKFYCKHCELREHTPDVDTSLLADLSEWTRTLLRVELTLRRPELKDRGTLNESIIWEFVKRLEVSDMAPKEEPNASLRPNVQAALRLWYEGTEVSSFYPRATAYRYRRDILNATGIDVFLPRAEQPTHAERALVSLDELHELEVRDVPARIQRSLFGSQQ